MPPSLVFYMLLYFLAIPINLGWIVCKLFPQLEPTELAKSFWVRAPVYWCYGWSFLMAVFFLLLFFLPLL